MRVCIHKPTGRLIESQSGGEGEHVEDEEEREAYRAASLDVLTKNAAVAGYSEDDIEVKFVTDEECAALLAVQTDSEKTYAERRRAEYPPMTDYLDGVVKGDAAQVQAYIDACLAIKKKYPRDDATLAGENRLILFAKSGSGYHDGASR